MADSFDLSTARAFFEARKTLETAKLGLAACDSLERLRKATKMLLLLVQHETGLPECAANGVGEEIGTDEGVIKAGEILEEARAALGTQDEIRKES